MNDDVTQRQRDQYFKVDPIVVQYLKYQPEF